MTARARARNFQTVVLRIDSFPLTFERATPEQIGIYCPLTKTVAAGSVVSVRYRLANASTWTAAHPLLRIDPTFVEGAPVTPVDSFAGTIFGLSPGTSYDVELSLNEPGRPTRTLTGTTTTRALPATAGAPNKTLTTAGNVQTTFNGLVPGDVLQLAAGTYTVNGLQLSNINGTTGAPIYIRGASRTGTIIKDTTGIVLFILEASNIIIENLTIEGSRVDSLQAASSQGIQFWSGRTVGQSRITIRDVDFVGVDQGVECFAEIYECLIYNCRLTGNNLWNSTFLASNGVDTWNDDGICMPGEGNCAWSNTLAGFGDAFSVKQDTFSAAVYFWKNKIDFTGDDSFEADNATRNIGFYDNYITNAGTLLSLDPVFGGPLYCFRNICINTFRGPHKWNVGSFSKMSGWMIYNNTVLRTEGTTGAGWYQPPNGDLRNWSYRNNLLVYRGTGPMYIMDPPNTSPLDFDHNAWFSPSDVRFRWNSTYYTNLATALSSLSATTPLFSTITQRHTSDVFTISNPWTDTVTLGADHVTQFVGAPSMALTGGTAPKNAGVAIPGITDGYSGAAPDIGATIEGQTAPVWGAVVNSLPAWLTTNAPTAGIWYELPNTSIDTVRPNPLPGGGWTTLANKIQAWVSMCVDEVNSYVYHAAGGGHNDYAGNEVDRLALNQAVPAWTERRSPTLNPIAEAEYFGDGRPNSRHHYYGIHFDPTRNQIMLLGGARFNVGTRLATIDAFDVASNDWLPAGTIARLPDNGTVMAEENRTCVIDPRNGNMYTVGNGYLVKLNRAANTVTTLRNGNNPFQGTQTDGAFDTTRNVFYFPNVGQIYNPDTDTYTTQAVTGAGAGSIVGQGQYSVFYYQPLDAFFFRGDGVGGGTVWKIDAASKVSTAFATSGGAAIPAASLLMHKFLPVPALKGAVIIPLYFSNAWFLRLET